jgi:hypothetical protein
MVDEVLVDDVGLTLLQRCHSIWLVTNREMVCIDQLIHAFHIGLQTGRLNRSFANNLIEGSHDQVVEFLDQLSSGPGRVDTEEWHAAIRMMYANRRGQN